MRKLLIIGGGGHSTVAIDTAISTNKYSKISYLDDNKEKKFVKKLKFAEYAGTFENALNPNIVNEYDDVFIALGDNKLRSAWYKKLIHLNYNFPSLVHPSSIVSEYSFIDIGSAVFAKAVIQANTYIGKFSIINTAATVDHDCHIGDFNHIAPGVNIAGGVSIGEKSFIGTGSCLIPNISVGSNVIVGAGSTLLHDLNDDMTAFGNPAKKIDRIER